MAARPSPAPPRVHVVLHQPEIPANTGAVGRTCVAVGAKLWLVRPLGFRLENKYLRRAGLDYWRHLDLEVVDDWNALAARLRGFPFWYFSTRGEKVLWEAQFSPGDVLVFGNETQGLPPALLASAPERVLRIPICAEARSLNLSNAVAVVTFEAMRQLSGTERQVSRARDQGPGGFCSQPA